MARRNIPYATEAERLAAIRESRRRWKARNKRPATEAEREWKAGYDARYREENRERISARVLAWKRADRRRKFADKANRTAAEMGLVDRLGWRAIESGDCVYCWQPADSWDHVIPMSRGGPNTIANLVPCCRVCNHEKRNRTPDEWIAGAPMPRGLARRTSR